jgi:hypothetical protein
MPRPQIEGKEEATADDKALENTIAVAERAATEKAVKGKVVRWGGLCVTVVSPLLAVCFPHSVLHFCHASRWASLQTDLVSSASSSGSSSSISSSSW